MKNPYNDNNEMRLEDICGMYGLDSSLVDMKEASENHKARLYGWPEAERYPLDTPDMTRLSWAYANEEMTGEKRDSVLGAIKKAADFWKIELPERRVSEEKPAYVFKVSGDNWCDEYKISNATELKSIAEHVRKNASDFNYGTRMQFADGVVNAPASLQSRLDKDDVAWLHRVRGEYMTDGASVKKACELRAAHMDQNGHKELGDVFREMADRADKFVKVSSDVIRKTASAFDYADRICGLTPLYGTSQLSLPELSIDGELPEKVKIACDNMVVTPSGSMTSRTRIAKHRDAVDNFFRKVAGEDTSKSTLSSLVSRIEKMDDVESAAFDNILDEIL